MKKQISKLGFEKFRITKLNNTSRIRGGSENQPGYNPANQTETEKTVEGSSMPCKNKNRIIFIELSLVKIINYCKS